jgi:hypothetical protein
MTRPPRRVSVLVPAVRGAGIAACRVFWPPKPPKFASRLTSAREFPCTAPAIR